MFKYISFLVVSLIVQTGFAMIPGEAVAEDLFGAETSRRTASLEDEGRGPSTGMDEDGNQAAQDQGATAETEGLDPGVFMAEDGAAGPDRVYVAQRTGGIRFNCRVDLIADDADNGFSALGINRGSFLDRIMSAYDDRNIIPAQPPLAPVLRDAGILTVEEWADDFHETAGRLELVHLDLVGAMYDMAITVYTFNAELGEFEQIAEHHPWGRNRVNIVYNPLLQQHFDRLIVVEEEEGSLAGAFVGMDIAPALDDAAAGANALLEMLDFGSMFNSLVGR